VPLIITIQLIIYHFVGEAPGLRIVVSLIRSHILSIRVISVADIIILMRFLTKILIINHVSGCIRSSGNALFLHLVRATLELLGIPKTATALIHLPRMVLLIHVL
jgi:hypothetical protein